MSQAFLLDYDDRLPWAGKMKLGDITPTEVLRGSTESGLLVVLGESPSEPSKGDLFDLWKERAGRSMDPIVVCVSYEHAGQDLVALLGPDRHAVPASAVERVLAERLIEHVLEMDSPTGLVTELRRRLASIRGGIGPGFRNEGLFATHVLSQQPARPDWDSLCSRSNPLLAQRREKLLTALGYKTEHIPDGLVLRESANGHRRAAAVLLLDDESLDNPLSRFHGSNAVTHGLALARRENVPWLIVLGGSVARLYPANPDVGVGRKGQTQTYVEVDLDLLSGPTAGYLALLFAPDALADAGTVASLLAESAKYAVSLSERLRDRVYERVIPNLAVAVAAKNDVWSAPPEEQKKALDDAYLQAMIILFRLLFVAYAEDRQLLPLDVNDTYTANALKTQARRILDDPASMASTTSTSIWDDLTQIWKVIDRGDLEGMGVPAYNGGLFTSEKLKNPLGAATYELELVNSEIGPVIEGLMIDETDDEILGLVDFRSLDVREFGTIYEGLLESGLAIADTDLTVDDNDTYVPAGKKDEVWVEAGSVYFHSRSGSRKATGSYFTKPFAVQHLLDQALEPAITAHLDKVKGLIDKGAHKSAAEMLFDLRVADLSMGSAHFLVAAVDRIEARFSEFLALNPLAEVAAELHTLRLTATNQLGISPEHSGIDDGVLLRRQIARRCIYGIDINEIAVELARLAVWIHTFVPGLPLSFLNHGLIHGNSLTGVGTLDEIVTSLEEAQAREDKNAGTAMLFDIGDALRGFLDRAGNHLQELGMLTDASIADVSQASEIQAAITESLTPLIALCDLITAERTTRNLPARDPDKIWLVRGTGLLTSNTDDELESAILRHPALARARVIAAEVDAVHLPARYPEVFRRDPGGFDCVLGNPPWEKLHVEEHVWWSLRFPGLRSLSQEDKNMTISKLERSRPDLVAEYQAEVIATKAAAQIVGAGPFPGIGAAHLDLFAAFSWRFWHEVRDGGRIGVVLPRTAMSGAATSDWRREILTNGAIPDLTTLTNTTRWAFDMEPRYTIALITVAKGSAAHEVVLRGPFANAVDYETGLLGHGAVVDAETVLSWSDTASIPLVPASDVDVFAAMKLHPALGADVAAWRFRPVQGDANATKEKKFFDFKVDNPAPDHTLAVWNGGSFNLWAPGSGPPYAWANPGDVEQFLQAKRERQITLASSAFYGLGDDWAADVSTLPMRSPRIAFRDVCRATDSRTMICSLVPPDIALVHKAPYLLRLAGTCSDEAYLLGILSSIPFDWLARRFVEISMTFELLNSFPVPRVDPETGRVVDGKGVVVASGRDLRRVRDRVVEVSGRLGAIDKRYAIWAKEVGVRVASVKTDAEKADLIAELDALVSLLYGLSRDQVGQVFASFHRGWDYQARLDAVLAHYDVWAETVGEGK